MPTSRGSSTPPLNRNLGVRRGDLVTVPDSGALPGDFGKPRPALVVQSDLFAGHAAVTVLPVTSTETPAPLFRLPVDPSPDNGLREPSFVTVDKAMSIRTEKLRRAVRTSRKCGPDPRQPGARALPRHRLLTGGAGQAEASRDRCSRHFGGIGQSGVS